MVDETAARDALAALFRAGIVDGTILSGVAYALSYAGKTRLEIVDFFWHLMNTSPAALSEEHSEFVHDFTDTLLGHCRLDQIVRLHGDPEGLEELGHRVAADNAAWRPPSESS